MHGWQANKKGTCAPPVEGRAMPENEIPPVLRGDIYSRRFYLMYPTIIPKIADRHIIKIGWVFFNARIIETVKIAKEQ